MEQRPALAQHPMTYSPTILRRGQDIRWTGLLRQGAVALQLHRSNFEHFDQRAGRRIAGAYHSAGDDLEEFLACAVAVLIVEHGCLHLLKQHA
ncbi:hypothetical protein EH240_23760 [Mesorhizobium tamadayense]|uniref:Uncharacterized protein n=1 Tax=Mesorhizobium tamadayense TaxID=425306 RepID=A0A3P3FCG3_9HYPH|nr:hypothetical protein [Mesorhizobium tamadayense]RRH96017.1 hypothetical protein EH240_23760 [Mesorhizobium tamadayense]